MSKISLVQFRFRLLLVAPSFHVGFPYVIPPMIWASVEQYVCPSALDRQSQLLCPLGVHIVPMSPALSALVSAVDPGLKITLPAPSRFLFDFLWCHVPFCPYCNPRCSAPMPVFFQNRDVFLLLHQGSAQQYNLPRIGIGNYVSRRTYALLH